MPYVTAEPKWLVTVLNPTAPDQVLLQGQFKSIPIAASHINAVLSQNNLNNYTLANASLYQLSRGCGYVCKKRAISIGDYVKLVNLTESKGLNEPTAATPESEGFTELLAVAEPPVPTTLGSQAATVSE